MRLPDARAGKLIALLLVVAPAARGEDAAPPARWHFEFRKALDLSILFTRRPGGDETRLLVAASGSRFELTSRQDATAEDSTESIRSLETQETLERRILLARHGGVSGCEPVPPHDACLLWKGVNGTLSTAMSSFSGPDSAEIRKKVEALSSASMKKRLFALAPALPLVAEFGSYVGDFLALVWPDRFRRPQIIERGKRVPGCDFDASFGFPCSAAEREKERRRFAGEGGRSR